MILLTLLSAIFAGVFFSFQHVQHSPQFAKVAAAADKVNAKFDHAANHDWNADKWLHRQGNATRKKDREFEIK